MNYQIIVAVLLGIGLSACTGLRVFVPMLVTSLAGYFDWLNLGDGFAWIGSLPAMIAFGVASVVEVMAYYIPVVDNALDAITGPLAVVAGTILTTSVLPMESDFIKWVLGIIVGGGSAGVVQAGTTMTRLLSSKATLTTANPVVATGENAGAIGGSVLAIFFPVIIGCICLLLIVYIVRKLFQWKKKYTSE